MARLYRKIEKEIEEHLKEDNGRMLVVDGARQVGKSFIIREVGKKLFPNFIEINMEEDKMGRRLFAEARTLNDFFLSLSSLAGDRMGSRQDTLVFIDEVQAYPHLLTMAKFLVGDGRFTYIASGSLLGVTLQKTQSVPVGSIRRLHLYPMDFEEFLIANGVGERVRENMAGMFRQRKPLNEAIHGKVMDLFRKYLLVGGLPYCVNIFVEQKNIALIRSAQEDVRELYLDDISKYESESRSKLKIQRIYSLIPSNLENKKKRMVAKSIEGKKGVRMSDYQDEFEYLISSGIASDVKAISQPAYPLVQNAGKNLMKLYMNDVGIFTGFLYRNNIIPILGDEASINLGSVYETVAAQELKAHGNALYYYDNKQNGEVDFLVDDSESLGVLPIEIKSGKDYTVHSALNRMLSIKEYPVKEAFVFSNEREVFRNGRITYLPIYYIMFL